MSRLGLGAVVPGAGEGGVCEVDSRSVARLLAGLREPLFAELPSTPSIDVVFDDLEAVLGANAEVDRSDMRALARRLHAVFRRLVHLSQVPGSGVRRATVAASSGLLTELMPQDFAGALGYLRRLALAVSGLLDELLEDMP